MLIEGVDGSYSKAFFDLQVVVAERMAEVGGVELGRALMDFTNLYIRFGLGHGFDAEHPVWREYLDGVGRGRDLREWTYRFYLGRAGVVVPPGLVASIGCFSYSRLSGERIRLHFRNAEGDGHSPLAAGRRERRLGDLAGLFAHVKATVPGPVRAVGASWLYNLEAYRRLFPRAYLATARPFPGRHRHMPLWGQVLDRRGDVRHSMAEHLLERLARLSRLEDLDACFPFQVLRLEAPADAFFELYGV